MPPTCTDTTLPAPTRPCTCSSPRLSAPTRSVNQWGPQQQAGCCHCGFIKCRPLSREQTSHGSLPSATFAPTAPRLSTRPALRPSTRDATRFLPPRMRSSRGLGLAMHVDDSVFLIHPMPSRRSLEVWSSLHPSWFRQLLPRPSLPPQQPRHQRPRVRHSRRRRCQV